MSKYLNRTIVTPALSTSRRQFLRASAALSAAGVAGAPFALNLATVASAAAQSAPTDYKALVCIFLSGGNDQANTVLATDSSSWSQYLAVRNVAGSALALPPPGMAGGVLPITPATSQPGRAFALHPALEPLKALFEAGHAAVVANVGPMLAPMTLQQFHNRSVPRPPKLFSHNDQQSLWQSYGPEGVTVGWGGRMGELLMANNANPAFTAVSAGGNSVFLMGRQLHQYHISAAGAVPIAGLGDLYGLPAALNPLRDIITNESTNVFQKDHAAVVQRAISTRSQLASAMLPASGVAPIPPYIHPVTKQAAVNPLAVQLQTVARMIGGRDTLGVRRQVFFVALGGFDTHDFQLKTQPDLLAKLAHAVAYFDAAMSNLRGVDLRTSVTSFTASDFGRTFSSNGDGTDHGWGSHHFVVGGAVKGGDIYGMFPQLGLGHAHDVGAGSLLPDISVDQYGATLGTWFGLSPIQLADVFPNLRYFASRNLGFMRQ
ncbi:DUF1501 domain-containing protein [Massilia sp. BSC265]|uniref:DUF1501 domain-containing protein n=1 Tax=Massilia sp. BSC265 TaxID=1549812 RepID=UPI0004E956AC|nr:DUF1501 domain-containing protein [Massilia sp. BSC265]KFI07771.1 hypothetical protein JN27_09485 [Massilia sp. BSC265]